jgi:hypothetical protein
MSGIPTIPPSGRSGGKEKPCSQTASVSRANLYLLSSLIGSNWQFGGQFHLLHGNVGLYVPDGLDSREVFHLKTPVSFQIRRDHPEEKITVSRHKLTLDHLRHLADFLDKPIYGFLILTRQPNTGEHGQT